MDKSKDINENEELEEILDEIETNNSEEEVEVEEKVNEETKIEEEISSLKDKLKRNLAEFDNFRKRTTKEKQSMYGEGVKDSVLEILPILDNFERALVHQENREDTFYVGIDMIFKQLLAVLDKLGVKEIECLNQEFDPNLHYAVAKEAIDGVEENIVIDVLQKGYMFKDKLLRVAMVRVSE